MKKLYDIIDTNLNWTLQKVEFEKFNNDEASNIEVADKYNITFQDDSTINIEYIRDISFENNADFMCKVSYSSEISIKSEFANKVSFKDYNLNKEIESCSNNIFFEASSKASYLISSIVMQTNDIVLITPPVFIKQKD